jgi:hypothetical protein
MGLGSEFAGSQRVSVGFIQSVLELLTMPGDIVLDWGVGDGSTFLAGDLCNRFVVGAEDRSKFVALAERAMADVRRRVPPAVQGVALATPQGVAEPERMDFLLSDHDNDAGGAPYEYMKDLHERLTKPDQPWSATLNISNE